MTVHEIDAEAYAPRTPEERFRLYVLEHGHLVLLATAADPGAIGLAIGANDDDCRQAGLRGLIDRGPIGILDAIESRWITMPWQRGQG